MPGDASSSRRHPDSRPEKTHEGNSSPRGRTIDFATGYGLSSRERTDSTTHYSTTGASRETAGSSTIDYRSTETSDNKLADYATSLLTRRALRQPKRLNFTRGENVSKEVNTRAQRREATTYENSQARPENAIDPGYDCHDYTFGGNRRNKPISIDRIERFIAEKTQRWASRESFREDEAFYRQLSGKLTEQDGRFKDHYFAVYRTNGDILHSSPIENVYQKDDGSLSIALRGKWGQHSYPVVHDIEDVPSTYHDQGIPRWEIRYAEQGRIMEEEKS